LLLAPDPLPAAETPGNLSDQQEIRSADLLRYNLRSGHPARTF
jgi:hypothetical protein